jgi:hypothetical protein
MSKQIHLGIWKPDFSLYERVVASMERRKLERSLKDTESEVSV